jgi:membrane protein
MALPELARRVWRRLDADDVLTHAAAMSFFMVFALFPAFLVLIAVVGLLPMHGVLDRLVAYTRQILPPDAASLVERALTQLRQGASTPLLSLGAGVALWSASSGMVAVINALNVAYRVGERRPWWKRRLVAVGLTVGITVFMVTALALTVFGGWLGSEIASRLGLGRLFARSWPVVQWGASMGCVTLGVGLVYRFAPAQSPAWRCLGPGALFAVLACLAASLGLRVYVTHVGSYNATYGSIGGVIVLMFWLFLSSTALLVGAEINSVVEEAMRARRAGRDACEAPSVPPAGMRIDGRTA